ncbi:uncharacterized protein LOC103959421 [Pyrus x bretschneideri]|uniref:uncharacterized protein LOC103959421 n=1 Tax=Pyrus x bretschneideri TaxID=225117 RepID=UPI00202FB2B3|nr:uncharacterized protein LOC103959421 [Pyrus x bretschneideri]
MSYNNVDNGNDNQGAGTIAVAIGEGVSSQNALKWAIDHLVSRSTSHVPIKLVHVQCETVLLEDQDVAEALVEYISRHGIVSIVAGATSRTGGLTRRRFKASESIPGRVLKLAPHFCSVYTIKRGRVSEMREASRPLPNIPAGERAADHHSDHIGRGPINGAYDEVSMAENDVSFVSSERPSTDSILSFYQNFGPAGLTRFPLESSSNMESIAKLDEDFDSFDFYALHEPSSTVQRCGGTPFLSQKVLEDMEEEMKRLRVELKQTMDMYHAACKEAVAAKQKCLNNYPDWSLLILLIFNIQTIELEEWKLKEEKKLEEARLALEATRAVEKKKANSKAAVLAADHHHEAAQRFAGKRCKQRSVQIKYSKL